MSNIFKWLYELGYSHAKNDILKEIERLQQDHQRLEEIAFYREKDKFNKPKMSSKDHAIRRQAFSELLTHLDPQRYPNFAGLLEKWL